MPERGTDACVTCFGARHYISSLPAHLRTWDRLLKVWLVDISVIPRLTSDLRRAGFEVLVDDKLEPPDTWADEMYAALGPELANQCHKVLTRVLHPDLGVDGVHMTALNVARDRAKR